jgi:hypothetical protein
MMVSGMFLLLLSLSSPMWVFLEYIQNPAPEKQLHRVSGGSDDRLR